MSDNVPMNPGVGGKSAATDEVTHSGDLAHVQLMRMVDVDGVEGSKTATARRPLTDAELRATPVPVSGPFWQSTQPVSFTWQGLTDAQLRASAVPVSFTWAGLTDAQLRASAVPVSFTWSGLTDAQLRASAVPVSASALPLPSGAATEATLATAASAVGAHDAAAANGRAGMVVLVRRRDSDAEPTVDDGDLTFLNIDEEGRLKTSSKPASYPDITGDITAIQATIGTPVAGGTVSGDVSRASNIMAFCTGTFAGVNVTFEGSLEASGDANWFGVQAVRSNANTIETTTGVLAAQPAYGWELSVNALRRVRVRCTARTSGAQSWRFVQGTYATEPIPAAQVSATQPVSFTQPAQVAGTALMGDVGLQVRANATGAASIHHIVSAATTNVAQIKATAGRVYGYCLSNTTASWRYVKLHNVASATAGAAVAMTIGLPPNGKAECYMGQGIGFATAISRSIVTGSADTDATAVAVGDVVGDIFFA
jgi:hypothetical protein